MSRAPGAGTLPLRRVTRLDGVDLDDVAAVVLLRGAEALADHERYRRSGGDGPAPLPAEALSALGGTHPGTRFAGTRFAGLRRAAPTSSTSPAARSGPVSTCRTQVT